MSLPKPPGLPALPKLPSLADRAPLELPKLGNLKQQTQAPLPDPLAEVDYSGSLEEDSDAEMSATLKAFKERTDKEADRFRLATDTEYWFAVCFQTREQKDAFLQAVKWFEHGDKYLDGAVIAKKLGVTLPSAEVPYNVSAKPDRRLKDLT